LKGTKVCAEEKSAPICERRFAIICERKERPLAEYNQKIVNSQYSNPYNTQTIMPSINTAIKQLIENNSPLFWFTPSNKKDEINEDQLVETILNYGDEKAVKQLLDIMGTDKVAAIFKRQVTSGERRKNNYHELVINFFQLYFKRHASKYTI
jgi:hypothetical protein